jgi:hypothetical protein
MLIAQLLPALVAVAASVGLRIFEAKKRKARRAEHNSGKLPTQQSEVDRNVTPLRRVQTLSFLWLMYWSIFNLVGFVCFAFLFFRSQRPSRGLDIAFLACAAVLNAFAVVAFCIAPQLFGEFRLQFREGLPAALSHCLYLAAVVITVALLCALPETVWAPMVPFTFFVAYFALLRPHRAAKGDFRCAFNAAVVLSSLGLRVSIGYFAPGAAAQFVGCVLPPLRQYGCAALRCRCCPRR